MSWLAWRPQLSGPLASRNFRLLAGCNVISRTGSAIAFVAIPFAVLRAGGSAADIGYVATAELLPLTAVLLLGGVAADRLPRHQVMAAANALQALAQGTAAILLLTGQARVWELGVLAAAGGAAFGLYFPAARGLLPQTVPASQLPPANALDRAGQNAAAIGGAAAGGLLVAVAGPGWALAIDALSFAVAGALRLGMRFPDRPAPPGSSSMLHDLRAGWQEFASRRWLWLTVALFGVITAISAATTTVLGPLVADTHLGGARSWGLIVAGYSAGAVASGLVMTRVRPRLPLVAGMLAVPAFSLLLFALAVPLAAPLDAAAATLSGACVEVFAVSWATTLQQEIPPGKLSRVSAYDALGSFAVTPAGTVIAGPLAAAVGVREVLIAGGVATVLLPGLALLLAEVRHLERR
ncbi:MAG TPA: MFS transporter [Streptosporangiaceae bacterium]|jgi:MFS family permease